MYTEKWASAPPGLLFGWGLLGLSGAVQGSLSQLEWVPPVRLLSRSAWHQSWGSQRSLMSALPMCFPKLASSDDSSSYSCLVHCIAVLFTLKGRCWVSTGIINADLIRDNVQVRNGISMGRERSSLPYHIFFLPLTLQNKQNSATVRVEPQSFLLVISLSFRCPHS